MQNKKNIELATIHLEDGIVKVIDHRNNNKVIIPDCGYDALLHHNYLLSSLRHGDKTAAAQFLLDIADGKKPITHMIESLSGEQRKTASSPCSFRVA